METFQYLEPVFQYRNWSHDNHPIQLHDDGGSLELDHLAQSQIFDLTTSGLQEWSVPSTSDVLQQSAELDDHSISRWQAPTSTTHQHLNLAFIRSIDIEAVPLPLGFALLRYLQDPVDPYPFLRLNHLGNSFVYRHNIPAHIGDELGASNNLPVREMDQRGTSSICLSVTCETVVSQLFRSATSNMGARRNAMVEAESRCVKLMNIRE